MIKAVIFDMYETLVTLFESPMYFSKDMAKDAGIDPVVFKSAWNKTITDRALGVVTCEQVIEKILKDNDCFTKEKLQLLSKKRTECKAEVFNHMNPQIIPMLDALKAEECLYIGDGGSQELETAAALNMKTAQATWYLKDGVDQPVSRLDGYVHLETPLEVLDLI